MEKEKNKMKRRIKLDGERLCKKIIIILVFSVLLVLPVVRATTYETGNDVYFNFTTVFNSEGVYINGTNLFIGRFLNGTIDDVMIFNRSLDAGEILEIYNNQSARFVNEGTQQLNNQEYLNISSGNNRVNVTTTIENLFGSQVNLSVGYYDTDWHITDAQTITNGTNYTLQFQILQQTWL